MIAGIGVDVVDLARFERALERTPGLRTRLFTVSEQALSSRSLAGRFAAKEALIKALGGQVGARWQEISVESDAHGRPALVLTGATATEARRLGVAHTHLSISHDAGIATAFVIAESGTPAAHTEPGDGAEPSAATQPNDTAVEPNHDSDGSTHKEACP